MEENYGEILTKLGYDLKDGGNYFQTNAVFRGGDNRGALQIYKDTGVWFDYVEGGRWKPFIQLVRLTLGTSDPKLIEKFYKDNKSVVPRQRKKVLLSEERTYDEKVLRKLLPHYDFYDERGIEEAVLREYKCGLATGGKMYQRIVFPIFNKGGKIHGFTGRSVNDREPKWLHKGRASHWIYPYYSVEKSKRAILDTKTIIIVESIGDSLALSNAGYYNNVVLFGLNISPALCCFLACLPVDKIFLSFNNDDRGNQGALKMFYRLLKVVDFKKIFYAPPSGDAGDVNDFGDMSLADIERCMYNNEKEQHKDSVEDLIDVGIRKDWDIKKLLKLFKFYYES